MLPMVYRMANLVGRIHMSEERKLQKSPAETQMANPYSLCMREKLKAVVELVEQLGRIIRLHPRHELHPHHHRLRHDAREVRAARAAAAIMTDRGRGRDEVGARARRLSKTSACRAGENVVRRKGVDGFCAG